METLIAVLRVTNRWATCDVFIINVNILSQEHVITVGDTAASSVAICTWTHGTAFTGAPIVPKISIQGGAA